MSDATVRQAREADYEAVAAFTAETWEDREEGDYIPDVFREWVRTDGPDQRTVVVEVESADGDDGADIAGVCQARLLSEREAWLQGMRVDPAHRGGGHGLAMVEDLFAWARDRGASVARNMVFSWNAAGLGQSLAAGFGPGVEFRWVEPEPRTVDASAAVSDPDDAWNYWTDSDACDALGGLALDPAVPWALSTLTRERLGSLAERERVFTVGDPDTRGMACRVRTTERAGGGSEEGNGSNEGNGDGGGESDDGTGDEASEREGETIAEYAVGAWDDADAAGALFDAVRADAAAVGADATRVLIPETPRHVAEAAAVRADPADWPIFVCEADLAE